MCRIAESEGGDGRVGGCGGRFNPILAEYTYFDNMTNVCMMIAYILLQTVKLSINDPLKKCVV